ncbi:hypothetical protein [Halovibrio salipaludis]|uniref:hypothetical protein n=1 Tax=Halovibrio salipaludis TaxID=2032626 RepID=UPI00117A0F50|nr:hypothetical protein [Halovibrio salipaludis]
MGRGVLAGTGELRRGVEALYRYHRIAHQEAALSWHHDHDLSRPRGAAGAGGGYPERPEGV